MLTNLDDVTNKFETWNKHLPDVTPFYAVKTNDDTAILKLLACLGTSFECASKAEIQKVLQLGVEADRIIFANTIKPESVLKYAAEVNVSLMTFDNEDELIKIHRIFPTARLLLRLKPIHDYKCGHELATKFGCVEAEMEYLLRLAQKLEMNIVGISFHVGTECESADAYVETLAQSRDAFNMGKRLGFTMDILNIGGGFPGEKDSPLFVQIANKIKEFIRKHFSSEKIKVIAEPGTYFVKSAVTICVKIIGRHVVKESWDYQQGAENKPGIRSIMYILNDGLLGRFAKLKWEPPDYITFETMQDSSTRRTLHETSIAGPSCSSEDVLQTGLKLPEHQIGEWFYVRDFGAYWMAVSMKFNRMPTPKKYFLTSNQNILSMIRET